MLRFLIFCKNLQSSPSKRSPFLCTLTLILVILFLVTGLTQGQDYGGELIVGMLQEPATLDPFHMAFDSWARELSYAIHIYPILIGLDGEFIPDATKSFEFPDDKTILFYFREDITFHDGAKMTADDFIYTLWINMNQDSGSSWYPGLRGRIESVQKIDDYTVKVRLVKPYGPILYSFLFPIISKDSYQERGEDYTTKPVGAGPFMIEEWIFGEELILKRFDDFYDGKPYLDRIIFKAMGYGEALQSFLKGQLDVLEVRLADLFKVEMEEKLGVLRRPGTSWYYLGINQIEGPLSHLEVRQAISYALNREQIIQELFFGEMLPATGPIVPLSWAYSSNVYAYDYNPARAVRLLNEAGFPRGFTLEIKCTPNAVPYMEMIQKQLRLVGIKVEIIPREWDLLCEEIQRGDFQIHYRAWTRQGDPERGINRQFIGASNINIAGYSNPRVDELAHQAISTLHPHYRKTAYYEIQEILAQDLPVIFLWYDYHYAGYHKRIKDFDIHPYYSFRTYRHMWVK